MTQPPADHGDRPGTLPWQMATLHNGLESLGVLVDEHHDRKPRMRRPNGRRERLAAYMDVNRLAQRLAASHQARPYHLAVVQLAGDRTNDYHGALISSLRGLDRSRVACVVGDARPPPVWMLWVPVFCGRAFVREMRLSPTS